MLGHGLLDALLEGKRWLIAEHAACLFDRVVEVEAEELVAGLVDDRRILGAAELGDAFDEVGEEPGQAQGNVPGRGLQTRQLGDPADELLLGHRLAVGQVEDLADGRGVLGGQKDPVDQVLDVDAVEHLVAGAEVGERAAPEVRAAAWAGRCGRARRR